MRCGMILLYLRVSFVTHAYLIDLLIHYNINNVMFLNGDKLKIAALQKQLSVYGIYSSYKQQGKLHKILRKTLPRLAIILNASHENWQNHMNHDELTFKYPFVWLFITRNISNDLTTLSRYPIEIDTDFTAVYENEGRIEFHEVYNTGFWTKGTFTTRMKGVWSENKLYLDEYRRNNMSGVVLKCMTVITDSSIHSSLSHYMELSTPAFGVDTIHKMKFFTMMKYLRDMYNLTYDISRTRSWGYLQNGSFDGMVGALQRRVVDIGCSPLFLRKDRAEFVDYTVQTWPARQRFVLRHPKIIGAFYTIFTRPLADKVWYSTLFVLGITVIFLSRLLNAKVLVLPGEIPDTSIGLSIVTVCSAICQQGASVDRKSTTIKIVVFCISLFSMTLYQYYNATVVASLLKEPPKNIRTLEDLVKSKLGAGIMNYPYNIDYFKRTTHQMSLKLYSEKIVTEHNNNIMDLETGMALVKKGGFAFHVDQNAAYNYMKIHFSEKEICELQEIQLFPPMNTVNVVAKGSPYREAITYGLRRMIETGLFSHVLSRWDQTKPDCVRTPDSSIFTVSLYEVSTPFVILAFGLSLSLIVLMCEILSELVQRRIPYRN